MKKKTFRIALVSPVMVQANKKENIKLVEKIVRRNLSSKPDLFFFPEANLIGGFWKNWENQLDVFAENIPNGPSCEKMVKIAKKYKTNICSGDIELENGKKFLTHYICGPRGFIGKQRKLFPQNPSKKQTLDSGSDIESINISGIPSVILACSNFMFPEIAVLAGMKKPRLVLCPADYYTANDKNIKKIINTFLHCRALEFEAHVFAVFGHYYGKVGNNLLAYWGVDEKGNQLVFATRKRNENKTKILEFQLNEPEQLWGSIESRIGKLSALKYSKI